MKKFTQTFIIIMAAAIEFSACSKNEEFFPNAFTDVIFQFNDVKTYIPVNELGLCWTHEIVLPVDDYYTWQSKIFISNHDHSVDKYLQASVHDYNNENKDKTYDLWMFSPALNVKDASQKVFSFYSRGFYWQESSSLEIYILNEPKSTASNKELLNVKIATPADGSYTWVASGDISLEGKGDIVYIGFRYQAIGGANNSTTYCIDDFAFGRLQEDHYIEKDNNPAPESYKLIVDTIYTFNNILCNYIPINELVFGWKNEIVSPVDNAECYKVWQSTIIIRNHGLSVDKFIDVTAHHAFNINFGLYHDLWMISPALNVKEATKKVFSFYSAGAYWRNTTSLEVYILNEPKSSASNKELLNVKIATPADNNFTWVASGDISLEGKGDIVYIGFRYQAIGGNNNSTTYCIDDFAFGRLQEDHYIEKDSNNYDTICNCNVHI